MKLYLCFDEMYLVIYDLFQAEYLACNSMPSYNAEFDMVSSSTLEEVRAANMCNCICVDVYKYYTIEYMLPL